MPFPRLPRPRSAGQRAAAVADAFERARGDEVQVRPWEHRLPRLVLLEIARSRGFAPAGGDEALPDRGEWQVPIPFRRVDS